MPVALRPAPHASRKWQGSRPAGSAKGLLESACPAKYRRCKDIIQSSFGKFSAEAPIYPSSNGFVRAAIYAYSSHHHLSIRPENVWFAILTQLSFFINGHAEEVRSFFVSRQGRKELKVIDAGSMDFADFGALALRMADMIAQNVVDAKLRAWIMPEFSTTSESDRVVASILMMGTMQQYFSYKMTLDCGIPSVTLLGVRADWEEMLNRLEMLPRLGPEPAQFYDLLKPVLRYFVMSFDSPSDTAVIDLWSKIAHESGRSGPYYLSGWITTFCFWKPDGKSLYAPPHGPIEIDSFGARNPVCDLNGTLYHRVDTDDIPDGHAAVPVTVDDNGDLYKARMVAGSVGIRVGPNGERIPFTMEPEPGQHPGPDSLQPVSGWWMYELVEGVEDKSSESDQLMAYNDESKDSDLKGACGGVAAPNALLREDSISLIGQSA